MSEAFYTDIAGRLSGLEAENRLRVLQTADYGLPLMSFRGKEYLNLSSNDYLGIANDVRAARDFLDRTADMRFGSTGSRLMTGNTTAYADFERELEQAYARSALVFGSGFQANTGILPALSGKGDLILADRLVHASIIDGILASKADFLRYRHNDYEHLEALLAKNRPNYRYVWIVSESIFSMDGDRADLARLADLRDRYDALLYVDEAHSVGTDGPGGLGMCLGQKVSDRVDIAVFPMGKAMASHGAFVLCSRSVKDYLVNVSRPMIFSTALPPVCVAWSAYVFGRMRSMGEQRSRLARMARYLRGELEAQGYPALGESHIVPVVFGQNRSALEAAQALRRQGIWATAVRYPTVPKGQARIRLSLSCALTDAQIEQLARAFKDLKR